MSDVPGTEGAFTLSDGTVLRYREAGAGPVLLMIPGWSQTAEQFKHQITGLSDKHHVIALDMRGHGASDKPDFGYRISRLAADVKELLDGLDLRGVSILGHSMGCSVIWSYHDLFGSHRLASLLLIDQMPVVAGNPAWSEEEKANYGPIFTPDSLYETINALAGPEGEATTRGFIGGMVTDAMTQETRNWMIDCNLRLPRRHAAALLLNHGGQDWRDAIARIQLPTLVVAGRSSLVPWTSCAWIHSQIPGAELEVFEEAEGGQHFMFIENPDKFNARVAAFLAR
ncbi:MAG: alpha/beta hydrolase [Pseudomonadota bacterium]